MKTLLTAILLTISINASAWETDNPYSMKHSEDELRYHLDHPNELGNGGLS